jgi:hypothetical protein
MIAIFLAASLLIVPIERPEVTKAQGMVESGMNEFARGKAKEKGAFQVIPLSNRPVPNSLRAQTIQAQQILNELLSENNDDLIEALVKYNSYRNRKAGLLYAKKVRQKALEVSMLELIQ